MQFSSGKEKERQNSGYHILQLKPDTQPPRQKMSRLNVSVEKPACPRFSLFIRENFYPPYATAINVAARQTKIAPVEVNQTIHFSTRSLFFTCAIVSSASPQRAIEK
jgi:hypothetical protein